MILSVAERSYLYDSLKETPPIRPDGRSNKQFRPIEAQIGFLQNSNGSAKVSLSDGSECIVSVKAKVVEKTTVDSLVEVDVEIAGERDDTTFISNLSSALQSLYSEHISPDALSLTSKFAFQLSVDALVTANFSHPLTLISFASYLALSTTYLPKLISSVNDAEIEEQPTFHELDFTKLDVDIPVIFTVAIVGNNTILDPNIQEMEVSDNGLVIGWLKDKPISPIENIKLNENNTTSIKPQLIIKSLELVKQIAPDVIKSLTVVAVEADEE